MRHAYCLFSSQKSAQYNIHVLGESTVTSHRPFQVFFDEMDILASGLAQFAYHNRKRRRVTANNCHRRKLVNTFTLTISFTLNSNHKWVRFNRFYHFQLLSLFSTRRICSRENRKKQPDWLATNNHPITFVFCLLARKKWPIGKRDYNTSYHVSKTKCLSVQNRGLKRYLYSSGILACFPLKIHTYTPLPEFV
jgi:hypothetical protein